MVQLFRTRKDGQAFPVSGVSSTSIIGAPVSKSLAEKGDVLSTSVGTQTRSQLIPLDFEKQQPAKAGTDKFLQQRYLIAAKNKVDEFRQKQKEVEGHKKAKDFATSTEIAEPIRKAEVKERTSEINQLRDALKDLPIGRGKKQKENNQDFKDDLEFTIKQAENDKLLIERMNWANSEQALKFAAVAKGDKIAQQILEAIRKEDFKKARKLAEERARRDAKVVAENSRIASREAQEILTIAGLQQNAEGQYVPTDETPEIASENLGIDLTPEELLQLGQTQIQAPPKLDPDEVLILAGSDEGERKLKQWGYIK